MRKCPACDKIFDDSKKFCQIDGTLLADVVETVQTEDPFKTVVVGQDLFKNATEKELAPFDEEENFDPLKTVVISNRANIQKPVEPKQAPPSFPDPPKFSEPTNSAPASGDLSPEPPKIAPPVVNPFSDTPRSNVPISNPFGDAGKMDQPIANPFSDSPKIAPSFSTPLETPKYESTPFENQANRFETPNAPASPFGSPFEQAAQQDSWTPPPAPIQGWQDQQISSNTPFQPPPIGAGIGQNQTLAIVSLVCGIVGLCCGISGIAALITGYIQRGNIARDPNQYGGGGMALAGMILGGISIGLMILAIILQIFGFALGGLR